MKKQKKKLPAPKRIKTDYLDKVYRVEDFVLAIPKAVKKIKEFQKKHPFDAIAFTGCSGAAFAFPLSYALKMPLICVRKTESSHYWGALEGFVEAKRYLIVDDFISSGKTIKNIVSTINKYSKKPKPIGIFLYDKSCLRKRYANVPIISIS